MWQKRYLTYEHGKVNFKKCWCLSLLKEGSIHFLHLCAMLHVHTGVAHFPFSGVWSWWMSLWHFLFIVIIIFSVIIPCVCLLYHTTILIVMLMFLATCTLWWWFFFKDCFLSFMLFCQCSLSYWYFIKQLWWVLLILASLTRILCREVSRFLFNSAAWSGSFKLW